MLLRLLKIFPNQFFAYLAVAGLMAGLVTSKVVLSVATITIFFNALININIKQNINSWLQNKTSMLLLGVLVLYLISGLYSENIDYWIDRCRMKLPFLALPLGFVTLPSLNKRRLYLFLLLYVVIMFIASDVVAINYLLNFKEYNDLIKLGRAIPTPMNDHIRFSIEVAFACILAFHLFIERFIIKYPFERWLVFIIGILLFIILHMLAVRSGLLVLYTVMLFTFIKRMFDKKRYFRGFLLILIVFAMGYASVHLFPSLNNRISYFFYEWELITDGDLKAGHSDAQRIVSTRYGFEIGIENPIIGIGAGDIKDAVTKKYKEDYGDQPITYMLPHNQFVFVFACLGIIGLILFIMAVAFPFFENKRYKEFLFTTFGIVLFLSLMTEHSLEIQIGTAFYLTFLFLFLNFFNSRSAKST
ncbi:MAG: O-antigen ligase family protein [Fimbriimonadaceae bacterium]|nr:O-antigen ligase family protein [Chitinophagales bacterium]